MKETLMAIIIMMMLGTRMKMNMMMIRRATMHYVVMDGDIDGNVMIL